MSNPQHLNPSLLNRALEELCNGEHSAWLPRAVFLSGSYARGDHDRFSDIDFLVITDREDGTLTFNVEDVVVEIRHAPVSKLLRVANGPATDNNNYILNMMDGAVLMYQQEEEGTLFQQEIEAVLLTPPSLTRKDLLVAHEALDKLLRSTERFALRMAAHHDPWLARLRLDRLVVKSIYLSYFIDRKRTSSLPALLKRLPNEYPQYSQLLRTYLEFGDRREGQEAALVFGKEVLKQIEIQSEEMP